jgi:shikimate dehydrogenase/3-dehydroquinate dehydratase type I
MTSRFRIIATVFEPTIERAIDVIRALPQGVDGIELRVDRLDLCPSREDFDAVRRATDSELIVTRRTTADYGVVVDDEIDNAMSAGFDWIDVEYNPGVRLHLLDRYRDRAILSFHDFTGMPDLDELLGHMKAFECRHLKIAVTPRTFAESRRLLALCADHPDLNLTVIGMGGVGLYTRILAPFFGSDLIFAASRRESIAAPGQLTLDEALEIFGTRRQCPQPEALFAVVGYPASHSRSPMIHNRGFFEHRICAAYSIIETESFNEVIEAVTESDRFAPVGLSVTAPYKPDAFAFARAVNAVLTERATAAGVVNTIVRIAGDREHFVADNTDVEGFATAFRDLSIPVGARVALVGAGSTARAALVAAKVAGLHVIAFNRTESKAQRLAAEYGCEARPLAELAAADASLVINTTSADSPVKPPDGLFAGGVPLIDVGYGYGGAFTRAARKEGSRVFDGLAFLEAQAVAQAELFREAALTAGRAEA